MNFNIFNMKKNKLFISEFVSEKPFLWSAIVFLGVELSLFVFSAKGYMNDLIEHPFRYALVLFLKYAVFVGLAFLYIRFTNAKRS